MTQIYDEINKEWVKDSNEFDENPDLAFHSRNIYKLHQKYHSWYTECHFYRTKLESNLKKLESDKIDYLNGEMDLQKIKSLGWPLQPKKMLKSEVTKSLQYDPDIIDMCKKIADINTVIEYLESIIKIINNRSFNIKNIIEYEKFRSGGS